MALSCRVPSGVPSEHQSASPLLRDGGPEKHDFADSGKLGAHRKVHRGRAEIREPLGAVRRAVRHIKRRRAGGRVDCREKEPMAQRREFSRLTRVRSRNHISHATTAFGGAVRDPQFLP
jgi:hypothetical protein